MGECALPRAARDRRLILSGLAWLDAESNARFGHGFGAAGDSERRAIFDGIAFKGKVTRHGRPAFFFARLRGQCWAASSRAPKAEGIGYIGNAPSVSYAGPSDEAMAHLMPPWPSWISTPTRAAA
jgi:hypothetical protein